MCVNILAGRKSCNVKMEVFYFTEAYLVRSSSWFVPCQGGVMGAYAPCTSHQAIMVPLIITASLQLPSIAGWHMIKFKINAPECTTTRQFYVKNKTFLGGSIAPPKCTPPQTPSCTHPLSACSASTFVPTVLTRAPHSEVWQQACGSA